MGVLFLMLAFIIYKSGYLNPSSKGQVDASSGAKDGSTPTHPQNAGEYKNAATSVYNAFNREGWFGSLYFDEDTAVSELNKLNNLSDADLISVANAYHAKYGGTQTPTLKELLAGEYLDGMIWQSEADKLRDKVVNRLTILNV